MAENVALARDGRIATVTLNRPDRRNSLSDPMLTELGAALAELRDDASTRVVILTGAPPVFSAGADAPIRSSMSPEERRQRFLARKSQFRRLFERATATLENLEQVTIAQINGHAVGGGFALTLACDFRWAAEDAQLWIPEVDLGVPLGVTSTTRFAGSSDPPGPRRSSSRVGATRRPRPTGWGWSTACSPGPRWRRRFGSTPSGWRPSRSGRWPRPRRESP